MPSIVVYIAYIDHEHVLHWSVFNYFSFSKNVNHTNLILVCFNHINCTDFFPWHSRQNKWHILHSEEWEKQSTQRKNFLLTCRGWGWAEHPPDVHMLLRANEPKGGRMATCFSLCIAQAIGQTQEANKRGLKNFHSEKSSPLNYMSNNEESGFFLSTRYIVC